MATCAKGPFPVTGTAHGKISKVVLATAYAHMQIAGRKECTGSCASGVCKFGMTNYNVDANQEIPDADGNGVTWNVYGEGHCFCV